VRRTADDKMTLSGVKIHPRIGVSAEERSAPQECSLDLTVWCSFEAAASTDVLDQSIDYCRILSLVRQIAEEREYRLLETLAYSVVRAVLQDFPIMRARVRVRKRPDSLMNALDYVEVEVEDS
jgi:dihydroneopterin aldolase